MALTVHMIGNAHLDPVWLWQKSSGLDEVLNTARTACDLLDAYPEFVFTRAEAWFHEQLAAIDPALFARIRTLAAAGRWQIVGGWWLQPDCNLPTAASFRKQGALGQETFRRLLGVSATVGYNVDSFGHCATLPRFLREAGMDAYVFMRPGEHEKTLPANVFVWRAPTGETVTVFRINHPYCCHRLATLAASVERAVAGALPGLGHTMCFYGVGDHGGGPTREMLDWVIAHRQWAADVELRFSHPRAFFDAIRGAAAALPEVRGSLLHHAVGCYTVQHALKQEMRRAETLAAQAEHALGSDAEERDRERLADAWRSILFNQFHDILGGTSIAEANAQVLDELGGAKATARDIILRQTRRELVHVPPAPALQLRFRNLGDRPFSGYVECAPWLGWGKPEAGRAVVFADAGGMIVPAQRLKPACVPESNRLHCLVRLEVPADGAQVLKVTEVPDAGGAAGAVTASAGMLRSDRLRAVPGRHGVESLALRTSQAEVSLLGPDGIRLGVFADPTDTWSHDTTGYAREPTAWFTSDSPWRVLDGGPWRGTLFNTLHCAGAELLMQIMLQAGEPIVRLRLRLHWRGGRQLVKLLIPPGCGVTRRMDACPEGRVPQALDGREYPMHDALWVGGGPCDPGLAVVSADTYGVDVQPDGTMRVTLLRSPVCVWHVDGTGVVPDANVLPFTDQGVHDYELALLHTAAGDDAWAEIDAERVRQTRPVHVAETTRGM